MSKALQHHPTKRYDGRGEKPLEMGMLSGWGDVDFSRVGEGSLNQG